MLACAYRHAALAGAILLVACGPRTASPPSGETPRPAVIPWISTQAGPDPTPKPTPAPTPLAIPFCRAADLSIRVGRSGFAAGTAYTSVIFTNRSATPCQLQGVPMVRVLDAAGQVLSPPQQQLDFNGLEPVELRPGARDGGGITPPVVGQAQLTIGRPTLECSPKPSTTILFILPGDTGQLSAGWSGAAFTGPLCSEGLWVSAFGPAILPTPAPTPVPQPDFAVDYVLPQSVAIGQTLKYEVVLTNVSGQYIRFATCHSYLEFLKGAALLRARYLLNCKPVGGFKSGESVTFAMEFPIVATQSDGCSGCPEWIRPGPDSFGWVIGAPFLGVNKTAPMITLAAAGGL